MENPLIFYRWLNATTFSTWMYSFFRVSIVIIRAILFHPFDFFYNFLLPRRKAIVISIWILPTISARAAPPPSQLCWGIKWPKLSVYVVILILELESCVTRRISMKCTFMPIYMYSCPDPLQYPKPWASSFSFALFLF